MTTFNESQSITSVRFTSIEPMNQYSELVTDIACRHGFKAEFQSETTLSAPFCGFDYHVQEVYLKPDGNHDSVHSMRTSCIKDLSTLEETHFADGYFEVIS